MRNQGSSILENESLEEKSAADIAWLRSVTDLYVSDLKALVDSVVGQDVQFHLVGLSMGAALAQTFAVHHEVRLRSLCLADGALTEGTPGKWAFVKHMIRLTYLAKRSTPQAVLEANAKMNPIVLTSKPFGSWPEIQRILLTQPPESIRIYTGLAGKMDFKGMASTKQATQLLTVPIVTLFGVNDYAGPVRTAWLADNVAAYRGNVEIAAAGHMSNMDNPAAFNKALLRFVSSAQPVPRYLPLSDSPSPAPGLAYRVQHPSSSSAAEAGGMSRVSRKEWVVFVHSGSADMRQWSLQVPFVTDVLGYSALVYDMMGQGLSVPGRRTVSGGVGHLLKDDVEDLLRLIVALTEPGCSVTLVGDGYGAAVVQSLVASRRLVGRKVGLVVLAGEAMTGDNDLFDGSLDDQASVVFDFLTAVRDGAIKVLAVAGSMDMRGVAAGVWMRQEVVGGEARVVEGAGSGCNRGKRHAVVLNGILAELMLP